MKGLNLYAYLTGHTGTYDLVLPWRQSEDGEIPDWPAYETWLTNIENETGLEYRDPSGAGEAHAWAYGNRSAMALLPEVDEEQNAPASTEEVEARLDEVLGVYELTWDNLPHLGGALHFEGMEEGNLTLHNDGWGHAYNVTLDVPASAVADGANASGNASTETVTPTQPSLDQIRPGETATLPYVEGAQRVEYERVAIQGDDPSLSAKALVLPADLNVSSEEPVEDEGFLSVPGPGLALLVAVFAALAPARTRRRS
jgi:hypothetical protein